MKKILLAVTGSISAYKSIDIARDLVKIGYQVRVILTAGACEFLNPKTFRYLGIDKTYLPTDDFNHGAMEDSATVLHIDLAKWADTFVIAPLSANTMAALAQGFCKDLLQSVFLSLPQATPKVLFPAMNTSMFDSPITQRNLEIIKLNRNILVIEPDSGELACGDLGRGKLPQTTAVSEIIECVEQPKNNRTVLITTGSTRSYLDPVRYLTNPSSGKSGYELAKSYLKKGYQVEVIKGFTHDLPWQALEKFNHFKLYSIKTTQELLRVALDRFPYCDLYISAAAPSDMEFEMHSEKLKKSQMNGSLSYRKAPDVLQELIKIKSHQQIVGFAAETKLTEASLHKKMSDKPVDLLIGNQVHNGVNAQTIGFENSTNDYLTLKNGNHQLHTNIAKSYLADIIEQSLSIQ